VYETDDIAHNAWHFW